MILPRCVFASFQVKVKGQVLIQAEFCNPSAAVFTVLKALFFSGQALAVFPHFNKINYIAIYLQEPTFHFKPQRYQKKNILKRLHCFSFMYLKLSMCAVWFINNSLNKNSI